MPLLLSAVVGFLLIHPSMGADAVDTLSSIAIMDPKLGVPLLLTVMFYSNIFTRKDVASHDMLVISPFCTGNYCMTYCVLLSSLVISMILFWFSLSLSLLLLKCCCS